MTLTFSAFDTINKGNQSKNKHVGQHGTKKLLSSKENQDKMKRQPIEQEKIVVSHISGKGLILKIH